MIEDAGGGSGGAIVSVPFDVEEAYGKKRVKVKVTIDGEPYRRLGRADGRPLPHAPRPEAPPRTDRQGASGEKVLVEMWEDLEPRVVNVPVDLRRALKANPKQGLFFRELSYTGQKEYVRSIEGAKREETRARRISRAILLLKQGKRGL